MARKSNRRTARRGGRADSKGTEMSSAQVPVPTAEQRREILDSVWKQDRLEAQASQESRRSSSAGVLERFGFSYTGRPEASRSYVDH
jgi:hypothetical protein